MGCKESKTVDEPDPQLDDPRDYGWEVIQNVDTINKHTSSKGEMCIGVYSEYSEKKK